MMAGTIEDVREKAEKLEKGSYRMAAALNVESLRRLNEEQHANPL